MASCAQQIQRGASSTMEWSPALMHWELIHLRRLQGWMPEFIAQVFGKCDGFLRD
jgi:hypothetical protein